MISAAPSPLRYGKLLDESIEAYHATDAVSKSKLDVFLSSPRLYHKLHVARTLAKPAPSDAFVIGNAVDAWAIEGEAAFRARYAEVPADAPKRPTARQINAKKPSPESLAAIEFWRNFEAASAGKTPIWPEEMAVSRRCVDALASHPLWVELRAAAQTQVTFRVKGEHMTMQCRPDVWCEEGCAATQGEPVMVDLKTISELPADEPDFLPRHIATYGYHRAAFIYREVAAAVMGWRDGWRPAFLLAFVEKVEPHSVVIRKVDELALAVGEREVAEAIARLIDCQKNNRWPESWDAPMAPVSLPSYYVRRVMGDGAIF